MHKPTPFVHDFPLPELMLYQLVLGFGIFMAGLVLDWYQDEDGRGLKGCAISAVLSTIGFMIVEFFYSFLPEARPMAIFIKLAILGYCFQTDSGRELYILYLGLILAEVYFSIGFMTPHR